MQSKGQASHAKNPRLSPENESDPGKTHGTAMGVGASQLEYVTGGRRFLKVTLVSSQGEMVWSCLNIRDQMERVRGTECHLSGENGEVEGPLVTGLVKMLEFQSVRRLGVGG